MHPLLAHMKHDPSPEPSLHAFSHAVRYHAYTLYLFTRSDMKTILFPITLFAWCTVSCMSPTSFLRAFFWTWAHLLQFCVSNQTLSPLEDARNKPWRPLPAGRLAVQHAVMLRWFLLPLCLLLSIADGVCSIGVVLAIGILLHNEMKLDSHWFTRNVLNAIGYAVFDAGATSIAQEAPESGMSTAALVAHYTSIGIVLTTIHAQDFQDEVGDREEKRRTIPIVMPRLGRISMPVGLISWSLVLCMSLHLPHFIRWTLFVMGGLVGARFYFLRSAQCDKTSYLLYNIWLAMARISPIYG